MTHLVGPYAVMIGMMLIVWPFPSGAWRAQAVRLREAGDRLRRHFPVTRDDGAFNAIIDHLDQGDE